MIQVSARAMAAAVLMTGALPSALMPVARAGDPVARFAGFEGPIHVAPLAVNPLKVEATRGGVAPGATALRVDAPSYDALLGAELAVFEGFVLDQAAGTRVDLELERFDVFTPDAMLVVATPRGEVLTARPDIQFWRGEVRGVPGSRVFLGITREGANGYVVTPAETYVISSGPAGSPGTVVFGTHGAAGAALGAPAVTCEGAVPNPFVPMPERANTGDEPVERATGPCKEYRIAVETDNEFLSRLGSVTNAQNYASLIFAASSEVYKRDLNIALKVSYLRIWTTQDPWTATSTSAQLNEFVNYWNANMGSVGRELAHFISPRGLGGGIAYLQATCSSVGYGVSANFNGSFPYPLVDHNGANWDINVTMHEMGHNFGTGHTHEVNWYNPIIDGCGLAYVGGTQDCSQAFSAGTIMSYCHLCPGGMSNLTLTFPPRVQTVIRNWVDGGGASCGALLPTVTSNPSAVNVEEGDPINLSGSFNVFGAVTYQWRRNGQNLTNGGRFFGVNTQNLTIGPSVTTDTGNYDLVVSGNCGVKNTTAAPVLVNPGCPQGQERPNITQQPDGAAALVGQQVSFTVAATGTGPLTYQWRNGTAVLSNGGSISGADSPTLTINPVSLSDAGLYNCVVTGPQCHSTSNLAPLAVTPPPPPPFALVSPAPGATGVSVLNTIFNWEAAAGAASYEVVCDNNSDFSSPVFTLSTPNNFLGITPNTLMHSTVYYWKVTASNPYGTSQSVPQSASFTTLVPPNPCYSDIDGNGSINTTDLALLLFYFGQSVPAFATGDINGDGLVNTADLTILLSEFGRTNCP